MAFVPTGRRRGADEHREQRQRQPWSINGDAPQRRGPLCPPPNEGVSTQPSPRKEWSSTRADPSDTGLGMGTSRPFPPGPGPSRLLPHPPPSQPHAGGSGPQDRSRCPADVPPSALPAARYKVWHSGGEDRLFPPRKGRGEAALHNARTARSRPGSAVRLCPAPGGPRLPRHAPAGADKAAGASPRPALPFPGPRGRLATAVGKPQPRGRAEQGASAAPRSTAPRAAHAGRPAVGGGAAQVPPGPARTAAPIRISRSGAALLGPAWGSRGRGACPGPGPHAGGR